MAEVKWEVTERVTKVGLTTLRVTKNNLIIHQVDSLTGAERTQTALSLPSSACAKEVAEVIARHLSEK